MQQHNQTPSFTVCERTKSKLMTNETGQVKFKRKLLEYCLKVMKRGKSRLLANRLYIYS